MDELVDILDESGTPTGISLMKSEAHQKGLFHATVHVWLYTADGHLLIQQRGRNKATFPLLWDVSVAGHIASGESVETSAVREVYEEVGLKIRPSDLLRLGVFKSVQKHSEQLIDCEFHHVFMSPLTKPLNKLKKQASEVETLALISLAPFKSELRNTHGQLRFVPHAEKYYQTIISAVERQLKV